MNEYDDDEKTENIEINDNYSSNEEIKKNNNKYTFAIDITEKIKLYAFMNGINVLDSDNSVSNLIDML